MSERLFSHSVFSPPLSLSLPLSVSVTPSVCVLESLVSPFSLVTPPLYVGEADPCPG